MGLFNKEAPTPVPKAPEVLDNVNKKVIDDLKETIRKGSKVSIAAASFSIYAFEALKKELSSVDEFRFLFTGETFTKEKAPKEAREFYIPRLSRERSLYGTNFEVRLRNELNQQAIAKECADWIRKKAHFRSNVSGEMMLPFMNVENPEESVTYNPFSNFTTAELGEDRGNNAYSTTMKVYAPLTEQYLNTFNQVWNDNDRLADVTDTVLENITAAYKENSPEFIYFVALYNIFSEFLEDIDDASLPNEAVGFKQSKVWNMLYNFQRDAVVGCITKLNRYGGCILADSVGLGKTFSALGVIKYFESRNQRVLVLCPKRLSDNWNTFKGNYKNNPLADDRLNYDVLYHTDLGRERGDSNGIDLSLINWGNYDLVVIDESHNFRNGEHSTHRSDESYENRYQKLIRKVIKSGVNTKVLMLSATPVNINFTDLKNQLMIASGGNEYELSGKLKTGSSLEKIFRDANNAFKTWSELEPENRTTEKLLEMLSFDFFDLLDSVTIARSRKHIEKYYSETNLGTFPERLTPKSYRPNLTDLEDIDFNTLFEYIDKLNLEIYTPLKFVHKSKLAKYVDIESSQGKTWENREAGRNVLMITNLLKRAESSVYAFRETVERLDNLIADTMNNIDRFEQGRTSNFSFGHIMEQINEIDDDDNDSDYTVGKDLKIELGDMDRISWRQKLSEDHEVLSELLEKIRLITPDHDLKLRELEKVIKKKIENPINGNNKKIVIFTAFADTADYLYGEMAHIIQEKFNLNSGVITGSRNPETNCAGVPKDFNSILTCFSPKSKNRDAFGTALAGKDIDILIATDCISEGQNLQDCDYLINYDIHWNPVRIIQRFGRVDRIGSDNKQIQLVNFWPNVDLDEYINLKARVENRTKLISITGAGGDVLENTDPELEYRKEQLERLQKEVVDLEEMNSGVSIMDLGLNEFHMDLQELHKKYGDADHTPFGISATAGAIKDEAPAGIIYVLKNINSGVNIDKQNRLHPFYLVYIKDNGEVFVDHLNPKSLLDKMRLLCKEKDTPNRELVSSFNVETENGKKMDRYSKLLSDSIRSIVTIKDEKDVASLFKAGGTTALTNQISGLDDFELINFLVVR